jgi:uncharacterized protein (TIGR02271 family)
MTNRTEGTWQNVVVVRDDGTRGRIVDQPSDETPARLALQFDDGVRLVVDANELKKQPDGTYLLTDGSSGASTTGGVASGTEARVIPVVAEELEVETRRVMRGSVQIRTRVETHEEVVHVPAVHEDVVVERVPVNMLVEGTPPAVREEGNVLVIPVLEEVVTVEKRLMLREVLRVSRHRTTASTPQVITLRREVVDVERTDVEGEPPTVGTDRQGETP